MGSFSLWHWIIVLLVVLLLFGRGRLSEVMGDFAKGIRSFKKGLAEDDAPVQRELGHSGEDRTPPLQPGAASRDEARRT